jgi:pimeloyl-ACP methyl ester carboxylesterase
VTPTRLRQTTSPGIARPTPPPPQNLTLTLPGDNAQLAATFYPPAFGGAKSAPGVLLLHMLGGCACRKDWDTFAQELQLWGVASLAIDFRGQGESPGPADWVNKAPGDVRAAWDYLVGRPEVDEKNSAILGASIGANLALIVGANTEAVVTVIALSPGSDYYGLEPAPLLKNFELKGQRPVLLIASQEDTYSFQSVRAELKPLSPVITAEYLTNAGHGTEMFRDPALESLILSWLQEKLGIQKG